MRIAALGDLHTRETSGGMFKELFSDVSQRADVLLLCGDLTDHGLPKEAEVLSSELASCSIQVLGVLGNHDFESKQQEEVRRILSAGRMTFLESESFERDGMGFAGIKGFCGGFDRHSLQAWGEETVKNFVLEAVNEAMQLEIGLAKLRTAKKFAVLHYAPIRQTVEGEPVEILTFLGSSRLVEPIDRFGVTAVFHGHAHNGMAQGKTATGIPVYNVSLPLMRKLNPQRPYLILEF